VLEMGVEGVDNRNIFIGVNNRHGQSPGRTIRDAMQLHRDLMKLLRKWPTP
jgi:hypothetical protein